MSYAFPNSINTDDIITAAQWNMHLFNSKLPPMSAQERKKFLAILVFNYFNIPHKLKSGDLAERAFVHNQWPDEYEIHTITGRNDVLKDEFNYG